jgi:hypothetical protein
MVKISQVEYDSGGEANSFVTTSTAFIQDSATDDRVTTFSHDVRGRVLLTTNPTAPHVVSKFDNMGRNIATGLFSSTASITVGSDDPTTETTNRMALSQTFYDERGQVWKSQRHQIDDADGSDDDTLQTLNWYDPAGRLIKTDGEQLTKTFYDCIGRPTHRFILANDGADGIYAAMDDLTGDIVLEEQQTTYNPDDQTVIMQATISRFHDDYAGGETTGVLGQQGRRPFIKSLPHRSMRGVTPRKPPKSAPNSAEQRNACNPQTPWVSWFTRSGQGWVGITPVRSLVRVQYRPFSRPPRLCAASHRCGLLNGCVIVLIAACGRAEQFSAYESLGPAQVQCIPGVGN